MYCSKNVLCASRWYLTQGLQKDFNTVVCTQFCHVEHIIERRCKFNIGIAMLAILCTALHSLLTSLALLSGKSQCDVFNLSVPIGTCLMAITMQSHWPAKMLLATGLHRL